MTQDKTNLQPNTFVFHNTNVDWVMRITADRRIEVNEGVEVTEAAQKVLDAMQQLLKAQRTWVDLTSKDLNEIFELAMTGEGAVHRAIAKFKQKNGFAEEKNT